MCCVCQGTASVVSGTPSVLLSSLNTDMVCERLKVIEGIDQSMLAQYTATIKKVRFEYVGWSEQNRFRVSYMYQLDISDGEKDFSCSKSHIVPSQANVNGRVLSQCNLDELKKEMNMNFGDWQLFRGSVSIFAELCAQKLTCQLPSSLESSLVRNRDSM